MNIAQPSEGLFKDRSIRVYHPELGSFSLDKFRSSKDETDEAKEISGWIEWGQ